MNDSLPNILDLAITDIIHGPHGIGHYNGYTIYVKHAVPGDTVRVTPYKKRPKIRTAYGRMRELLHSSPLRIKADCPHFPDCGGCQLRDIGYSDQLDLKMRILRNELKQQGIALEPGHIVPAPESDYYRNKMEYTFGSIEGEIVLGMHRKGNFASIVHTPQCRLQSRVSNTIREIVISWAHRHKLTAYNPFTHAGLLRHLVIREGKRTNQQLVMLVTSSAAVPGLQDLKDGLCEVIPSLTGLVHVVNTSISDTVTFGEQYVLYGSSDIEEILCDRSFVITPQAFFQTNSVATETLYTYVREQVVRLAPASVLDLYCGTGSIGLFVDNGSFRITGVDINEANIAAAERNRMLNNTTDISFVAGDVRDFLSTSPPNSFELTIIDPPREGIHPKSMNLLRQMGSKYIVYVSCNPKTLARDLVLLQERYDIESIKPFDLFPFTPHMENVAVLVAK